MKPSQDATSLFALIPQEAILIDLEKNAIAAANSQFETTFGMAVGASTEELRALFMRTPLIAQIDKTITTELRAKRAAVYPQFAMHTLHNDLCNFDLHISYADETKSAVYIIFAASAHDAALLEHTDSYYETTASRPSPTRST